MIRQEIDISGWWRITVFYMPEERDMRAVIAALEGVGAPRSDIAEVRRLFPDERNKGVTKSSGYQRHSVTVIGLATSWDEFLNTVLHEIRHVVDDITAWYNVMNWGEPPAYLQGEIGRLMAPAIRRIACPCCGLEYKDY